MESGWHIYWQNPGDSGEPPRIQWQLPAGVTAGALQWPPPMRLTTTAGADYGYQSTTVLLSSLLLPTTIASGTIEVGGDLRWLVCHDICVPQKTHLQASLRVGSATSISEAARQLLQSAAERLPKPLPASFRPEAVSLPDGFRLMLVASEPVTQLEFFPSEIEQIDNGAPQEPVKRANAMSLTLKKSEYLRQQPQQLKGILVFNGRNAYQLDVPIHNKANQKRSHQK